MTSVNSPASALIPKAAVIRRGTSASSVTSSSVNRDRSAAKSLLAGLVVCRTNSIYLFVSITFVILELKSIKRFLGFSFFIIILLFFTIVKYVVLSTLLYIIKSHLRTINTNHKSLMNSWVIISVL